MAFLHYFDQDGPYREWRYVKGVNLHRAELEATSEDQERRVIRLRKTHPSASSARSLSLAIPSPKSQSDFNPPQREG